MAPVPRHHDYPSAMEFLLDKSSPPRITQTSLTACVGVNTARH